MFSLSLKGTYAAIFTVHYRTVKCSTLSSVGHLVCLSDQGFLPNLFIFFLSWKNISLFLYLTSSLNVLKCPRKRVGQGTQFYLLLICNNDN